MNDPNFPKQRGIYSEKISIEASAESMKSLHSGPSANLIIHTSPKYEGLKAISITNKSSKSAQKPKNQEGYYSRGKDGLAFVEPKVTEPFSPIPGRVPRKVAIDRKKKEYASFNIEAELGKLSIDFNQVAGPESWLKLELFDDKNYDDYTPKEWLAKGVSANGEVKPMPGYGLCEGKKNEWKEVLISGYDDKAERFTGVWVHDNSPVSLPRIYLLFDAEDPRKFAKRVANAFQQRIYADSVIHYNYFIDNMPTQDLNELDSEQQRRLEVLATNTRKLRDLKMDSLTFLKMEVSGDYARTMNKIIFNNYMDECTKELLSRPLQLPPVKEEQEAPLYGMIQMERNAESKDFTEIFKDFCFNSLYIKEEVIRALQEIKIECTKALDLKLFQFDFPHTVRMDDFKHQQDSIRSQVAHYLQNVWVNDIVKIIKLQFSEVGKGWFNIKEPNKTTYDFGKLKKFLIMVRQMMQDNLLNMIRRNYYQFFDTLKSFVPTKVEIIAPRKVKNFYADNKLTPSGKEEARYPLFQVDLVKPSQQDDFNYSTSPQIFVTTVTNAFTKTLDELAKIPDVEQKALTDAQNPPKNPRLIKVPVKPKEAPIEYADHEKYRKQHDENKWVWDLYNQFGDLMQEAIAPLNDYLKVFEPYRDILKLNPEQYIKDIEADEQNPKSEENIKDEIHEFMKKEKELRELIPEEIHVSCFSVNCKELIGILAGRYANFQKALIDYIARRARDRTTRITNQFKQMERKILFQPQNIEELTSLKEYIAAVPQELEKVKVDINNAIQIYGILEQFNFRFPVDDLNKRWQIFGGPKNVMKRVEDRNVALEKEKTKFQDEMVVKQEEFRENIENLERTILGFHQHQKLENHGEIVTIVNSVNGSLEAYNQDARTYNSHESLFGLEMTDYSKLQQMQKDFAPYSNLWTIASQWYKNIDEWLTCEWEHLDAEAAERWVEDAVRILASCVRFFKDKNIGPILKIAEKVKAAIDEFRPKVPLMVALRKKGMQTRHWDQISAKVGFKVLPDANFTFAQALELGLMKNVDAIVEIGERAANEYSIETMLNDMLEVWEKILFEFLPFKQTWIIRGYDEINAILDEHIVQTQAMTFSPFKKPFEERINDWNNKLLHMSTTLEEWAKCQGQYMYLQPIFDSPDISKQLPNESKKFKSVDSTWKFTLTTAKALRSVLRVCSNEGPTEGLLEKLHDANRSLEVIQKELNNYLEKKREAFARFYFLSNDELLEILSQAKEPTAVQPHLGKVFENINKVEFDDKKIIHSMYSGEGEQVKFVKTIDPNTKNVEFWMGDLEEMMKISVRDALLNSVTQYTQVPRAEWVISHPGQCVLNGSQVHWTAEVEEAIKNKTLKEYLTKSQMQISELVKLIRTKLSKMQSTTINALIVIDVHAKDVVEKLHEAQIDDTGAFEWISQLRYYWESDDCYVKCIQTNFPYGYEYLGNTLRLVITPLTDKCYMTLMGALKLNLGGAPAGPAGTGKTESTKDLAKALAKQCVVFNCSEGMDYTFVGKFFKGLASAGAWACFDEFNRINVEVLSVIAQQLLTLFGAKARDEKQVEFEGSLIKMNPTFCVFITMNPGYAGRTELPDNLKALFRPVAMMVPDYALIGEIMLYSFGFDTARDLARKMVATFKLSSEQLSSQDHYDYGMRAVRSVINAAGLLKRADPDMNEEQLLLRALRDVNVPKFLKDDLPLFENIISDLFPNIERPKINYGDLLEGIKAACTKLKLQPTDVFMQKVLQLYDTIQVRHGLMLVGPTGGGKTCNYKVLQEAMTAIAKSGNKEFSKVHTHILNPKSITMGQLYGNINEQTKEWTDGILASIVRETVKDVSGEKHWVMFDGPVDALWIESMNTVLDDNKKLCLNSGQILVLTPYMTMMFEVEDLAVASPATVSRCGMVYIEPVALGIQPLIDSWTDGLPQNFRNRKNLLPNIQNLYKKYMEPSIEFMQKNCKEIVPARTNALVQSFMKLIDCYLLPYRETEFKKVPTEEMDNLESFFDSLFVFCLVWSVGCTVDLDGRKRFDAYLREKVVQEASAVTFPEEGSIYDFVFNPF